MSGERRAVANPFGIDLSAMPVPPLKFVLQENYVPSGLVETTGASGTVAHSPWYSEVGLSLTGVTTKAVLYMVPWDDDASLRVACLGEAVEPLFQLLAGADFGDAVTRLVATHWSDVYRMLAASVTLGDDSQRNSDARIIARIATPGRMQWVVADPVRGSAREEIPPDRAEELILAALETYIRVTSFGTRLPGIVDALSGPDRVSRRLSAISGLFDATADIGSVLQGGVQLDELVDLAQGVRDFADAARDVKD